MYYIIQCSIHCIILYYTYWSLSYYSLLLQIQSLTLHFFFLHNVMLSVLIICHLATVGNHCDITMDD